MARDDRIETETVRTAQLPEAPVERVLRRPAPLRDDRFGEDRQNLFLVALRKGETVFAACRLVGISNRTAYNHRQSNAEFAKNWALARHMARLPLELVAFERAVVGIAEPVRLGGGRSFTRRRYSDSLLRLLLQGEQPRKYGRAAGVRTQRKWLKKQIARQIAAALGGESLPGAEAPPPIVNFVNPDSRDESVAGGGGSGAERLSGPPKNRDFACIREPAAEPQVRPPAPGSSAALRSSCAASAIWAGSPPGNKDCADPRPPNNPGDNPRPATMSPAARSW